MKIVTYIFRNNDDEICLSENAVEIYWDPDELAEEMDDYDLLKEFILKEIPEQHTRYKFYKRFEKFKESAKQKAIKYEDKEAD